MVSIVVLGSVFPLVVPKGCQVKVLDDSSEGIVKLEIRGKIVRLPLPEDAVELIKKYKRNEIGVAFYLEMEYKGEFKIRYECFDYFNRGRIFC